LTFDVHRIVSVSDTGGRGSGSILGIPNSKEFPKNLGILRLFFNYGDGLDYVRTSSTTTIKWF